MIGKRFCPRCNSENVELVAGGVTGTWMCKQCGFSGIFPEKTIVGNEMGMHEDRKEKGRRKK